MPIKSKISNHFSTVDLLSIIPPKQKEKGLNLIAIADEFWQDIQENGINYRGDRLEVLPWHEHYAKFIADLRIPETLVSGSSQIGKTVWHTNLFVFLLVKKKLNLIWTYAGLTTLNQLVPQQFRPLIRNYLDSQNLALPKQGKETNALYQYGEANASFKHVGVNVHSGSGLAAARGANVGESGDIAFLEERSQYPVGSEDPIRSRLNNSQIETKPVRQLGTPGAGLGIESEMEKAEYLFHPFAVCPHCQSEVELHPKGCLLKSFDRVLPNGEVKPGYLSATGKPAIVNGVAQWYHYDSDRPIESAYIACPHCLGELDNGTRKNAYFKCVRSGQLLSDFLNTTVGDRYKQGRYKAGFWISPLLRITEYNLASDIIGGGVDTENPANWCQQSLGLPSEAGETSVTLEMIRNAIAAPKPTYPHSFTVAGIDQGRHSHYLAIFDVYLPPAWQYMNFRELRDQLIKVVRFGGSIYVGELIDRLVQYNVDLTIIDNEPNISEAARLAADCPQKIELANQVTGQLKEYKQVEVHDGGDVFPCWSMRSDKYQRLILDSFLMAASDGFSLYRLPDDWLSWFAKRSESSPIRHLTSPSYDPSLGKWVRARDHNDDLWFAFHFAELAIDLYLQEFSTRLAMAQAYGEI